MQNIFNSIKLFAPKKNKFDLTHDVKLSFDMGELVPTLVMPVVPTDRVTIGCEMLNRFAPLVAPVMHRFDASTYYFFVPKRLLWPNWEKWLTDMSSTIVPPYFEYDNNMPYDLADYMGLPPIAPTTSNIQLSPMAFAAYQMIYNEYFRDEYLVPEVNFELTDGDNSSNADLWVLRKSAWEHDYYTSALPFAQKGASVSIPLGDITLKDPSQLAGRQPFLVDDTGTPISNTNPTAGVMYDNNGPFDPHIFGAEDPSKNAYLDPNDSLEVQATTISDLRRAFSLQKFLEKLATGGSRLSEFIYSVFGKKTSDARLQRPEYIVGVKTPITISEVLNTTGETLPQGNMAGHGLGLSKGNYGSFEAEEHGYIIGITRLLPKTAYQQGIPKHFLKITDQVDEYIPDMAHIGEQPIVNAEIYIDHTNPQNTFGYTPRYAEFKFMENRVAGSFRTTLDYWAFSRKFATAPALNQAFIECTPGKDIFAVTDPDTDSIYCNILHKIMASRPMPVFGTPSI